MSTEAKDLRDAVEREVNAALEGPTMDRFREKIRDLGQDLEMQIYDSLKESLAINLSDFTYSMAAQAIEALLQGDEKQMRRYLHCTPYGFTGRSDGSGFGRKKDPHKQHPVMHGELFEPSPIRIRRRVVEAHRDLITDERIKDLEDQVASLTAQVVKLQGEDNRQIPDPDQLALVEG